jgi:alanyl-tRNA synthetase
MTDRLYDDDPYLTVFDAHIARVDREHERTLITLERTAFYPTSGGQPHDTGRLASTTVVDVFETAAGDLAHVVSGDSANLATGAIVSCAIDWDRRFDHMQQHTGQHVLSASFDRLLRVPTKSFHLGNERSTIDLAREISDDEARQAEADANRIVWENRPVVIRYVDGSDVATLPLRKASTRSGRIRLIDIDRHDLSACGGTHVARTGGVGAVVITNVERHKAGSRVEFVCGAREVRVMRDVLDSVSRSIRLLSVLPAELPASIERLQADHRAAVRSVDELRSTLAGHDAARLATRAVTVESVPIVCEVSEADDEAIKQIAGLVATEQGMAAVLVANRVPCFVVAASPDGRLLDASDVIRELVGRVGGRGGGKPRLAQAGGIDADADRVLAAAREAVASVIRARPTA